MISVRQNSIQGASRILLLCTIQAAFVGLIDDPSGKAALAAGSGTSHRHLTPSFSSREHPEGGAGPGLLTGLRVTHLTSNDGLSHNHVLVILQDHRGFMWIGTERGLDRYDGNSFTVYKNNPIWDLLEDDRGNLWLATSGGVNKFDPATERSTAYVHDPNNTNSLSSNVVQCIARDGRGAFWFGTLDGGLDRFDPATETFTHYRRDSEGKFVGRITRVLEDRQGEVWFVGENGLYHLSQRTGQIAHPPGNGEGLDAGYLSEDEAGNLWILAKSPLAGLVKYDRQRKRFTAFPFGAGAVGIPEGKLLDDGKGFWVPSNRGLYYFDRGVERFTRRFFRDESDPDSLNDDSVVLAYQDRAGLLWVGTQTGGLNLLNFRQAQFGRLTHLLDDPKTLSSGEATALYLDPDGVLWVGFFPRALDRVDRKTGKITHFHPVPANRNGLSSGNRVGGLRRDSRGYLWIAGWASGLDRYDERTGRFKHYAPRPGDPRSLPTDNLVILCRDRTGGMWVGHARGLSRYDPATDGFTNYLPDRENPASLMNYVASIHQDRSGNIWLSAWAGTLNRFDEKNGTFVPYVPDARDHNLHPGGAGVILADRIGIFLEDHTGTLWVGFGSNLYRYDRQKDTFLLFAEDLGAPEVSDEIKGMLEDATGKFWLSTEKGLTRFDPGTKTSRHYDVSDGLQANEFSWESYEQGRDGEMFFGGTHGVTAFFPVNIRDNPHVPPVVISSFRIFNKPVSIGPDSVLKKAIPYVDSLTLPYRDSVFSLEFAALSYANSQKNRYRYKLENFDRSWNEADSKQRLATYTNLDPGKYVFRVQGSNSDGLWNEKGASLTIFITPPWWKTVWFRAFALLACFSLVWALYRLRVHQVQEQEKKFREAVETMPALAFVAEPGGKRIFVNRGWLEYTSLGLEQALDSGWQEAIHPDDLKRVLERWRTAEASGQLLEYEARIRRGSDAAYRWFQTRARPLRDKRGRILNWCAVATDIEDRKRAEQLQSDLAHINRVSLMGEMAASLAHEIKQPIAGAITSASSGRLWLDHHPPNLEKARAALERIERDGNRAASIIDRLRSLYKKAPPQRELLAVNDVIGEMAGLLRGEANRYAVSIRTDFADGLPPVIADRVQIQQVLMNLMLNSIEAMGETGGVLTVKSQLRKDGQVEISVNDTGPGLPPGKADQIFDAFFTTKPQGSGMGLAISKSIVESHGGRIWANGSEGLGATFHFSLPAAQKEGVDFAASPGSSINMTAQGP